MFHEFDLHIHTPFSDGQHDIDTVLKILIKNGIKICGFADHIFPGAMYKHKQSGLANNFSAEHLKYRKEVIKYYNKKYPEITILNGGEIDLYPHGKLTLPKGIEPEFFDYLLVAKHHSVPKPLNLWKKFPKLDKWMWRNNPRLKLFKYLYFKGLEAAFQKYHPDVFAHPQEGLPKFLKLEDFKRLIYLCKKYDVAFELNHFPIETLKPFLVLGKKYGIKFSLASDFHGFSKNIEEQLNHSQKMYELVEEYGLDLIDPRKFVPK